VDLTARLNKAKEGRKEFFQFVDSLHSRSKSNEAGPQALTRIKTQKSKTMTSEELCVRPALPAASIQILVRLKPRDKKGEAQEKTRVMTLSDQAIILKKGYT
jgi:hypothetical protein